MRVLFSLTAATCMLGSVTYAASQPDTLEQRIMSVGGPRALIPYNKTPALFSEYVDAWKSAKAFFPAKTVLESARIVYQTDYNSGGKDYSGIWFFYTDTISASFSVFISEDKLVIPGPELDVGNIKIYGKPLHVHDEATRVDGTAQDDQKTSRDDDDDEDSLPSAPKSHKFLEKDPIAAINFKTPEFKKASKQLHRFLEEQNKKNGIKKRSGGSGTKCRDVRKYDTDSDWPYDVPKNAVQSGRLYPFLLKWAKEDGHDLEFSDDGIRFNHIKWIRNDELLSVDEIVIKEGEFKFKLQARKERGENDFKDKEYLFQCSTSEDRDSFVKYLKDVLRTCKDAERTFRKLSRRRLRSRPIHDLMS